MKKVIWMALDTPDGLLSLKGQLLDVEGDVKVLGRLDIEENLENIFIGKDVAPNNISGSGRQNVYIGHKAGEANTLGASNVFVGWRSGDSNEGGGSDVFIGNQAGESNINGRSNVFIGSNSGKVNTSGNFNTFVGALSSSNLSSGITTGTNNTSLGYFTKFNNQELTNSTVIGANAEVACSNCMVLGGTGSNRVNVGIDTQTPLTRLHLGSGADVSLTGHGYFLMGSPSGVNMAIDPNEIQGRNNGQAADFWLQFAGGNVGIGSTSASFQLHLSRNSAAKPTSSVWSVSSDRRLKANIENFEDGLEVINKIRPVTYFYNGKANLPTQEQGIGTIAQELEVIAPYMVKKWTFKNEEKEEDYLTVDYHALPLILVNAVQEMTQKNEQHEAQITQLKKENQNLETELNSLRIELNQIRQLLTVSGFSSQKKR